MRVWFDTSFTDCDEAELRKLSPELSGVYVLAVIKPDSPEYVYVGHGKIVAGITAALKKPCVHDSYPVPSIKFNYITSKNRRGMLKVVARLKDGLKPRCQ